MNINNEQNISNDITGNIPQNKNKSPMFNLTYKNYKDFLKSMEKSDFSNSPTRYITEYRMLESLLKYAIQDKNEEEINSINQKLEEIKEKLLNDFGITLGANNS